MSVYAHNLSTPHAVLSDEEIEAAHERSIAAAAALAHIAPVLRGMLGDDPEVIAAYIELLTGLAYLGYTVEVREMPDGAPMIYLPDALSLHINTDDNLPVVWLAGLISPRDWLVYGERITAALLDAKGVR